jgi:hypothetical protein
VHRGSDWDRRGTPHMKCLGEESFAGKRIDTLKGDNVPEPSLSPDQG